MKKKPVDPYGAIRKLAAKLQEDGAADGEIIDSLLVGGINLAIRVLGKERVATDLEKIAAQIRQGQEVNNTHH